MENIHTPGCSVHAQEQHCWRMGVGLSWCAHTHRIHTDVCKNKWECQECVHLFLGNTLASLHPNRCMEEVGWWVFLGFHSKSEILNISYHSTYQNQDD